MRRWLWLSSGEKVEIGIVRSGPGPSGSNRGSDFDPPAPQGDEKTSIPALDEVLRKVLSGRVRMTAIKCEGNREEQIPVPLVELNDLMFRFVPGHGLRRWDYGRDRATRWFGSRRSS